MLILGIETSCDETSIGIVEDGEKILANVILTQTEYHKKFYGVVPEIASRVHSKLINKIFEKALEDAKISYKDLDAIAVVNQPGLVGSLMVGVSFAKSLSLILNKPLISVNHLYAHLYANFFLNPKPQFPYIGLIVSGGHTLLLVAFSLFKYEIIGTTLDDAVGESFDKIAKFLNLGYPGGHIIDKIASDYKKNDYVIFPKALLNDKKNIYNFSYSGLKTAVINFVRKNPDYDIKKIVKGFQISAIDILYEKTISLAKEKKIKNICIAGGVAANSYLRKKFLESKNDFKIFIPEKILCTDNGAIVAGYGYQKAKEKLFDDLKLEVFARPKGGPKEYLKLS